MSELTDAVICEPLRTPVGRYGVVFRNVPAEQLAATVIRGLLKRTGCIPHPLQSADLRRWTGGGRRRLWGRRADRAG